LPPLTEQGAERPCVCIEVTDDGGGLSEAARAKVFVPFFTSKGLGATGLGLATSLAIVRDHQGSIECRSEEGRGTTFIVSLPRSREPVLVLRSGRESEPPQRRVGVLLVDDEVAIRNAVGQVLQDAGIRVIGAGSGAEALARLAQEPEIDVVMLDRSMPDGPGENIIARVRELAPRARVAFFSGQAMEPQLALLADAIVHKPVDGRELVDAIVRLVGLGPRTP
jgi:two-component system cell cycle sensor histidine kinase/response regulator CckA